MCTLIAAVRIYRDHPLVIAANRDESLTRPATGPRVWTDRSPRFIAPRDEQAGGTWLGLNEHGVFVGVTNRFGAAKLENRRSRGQLVVEALAARSAEALHQQLQSIGRDEFNAFHLFYADAHRAFVTWSDGERIQRTELPPGLHVITERSLGGDDHARTERARANWPWLHGGAPSAEEMAMVLAIHDPADPLSSLCVHAPAFNYGTRSSFLLKLAPALTGAQLWSSDEAPCQTPPVERPELIASLTASAATAG